MSQPSIPQSIFEQVACPTYGDFLAFPSGAAYFTGRVKELSFTSFSLGTDDVYRWDPARRELHRAELDAAMFHLYGLDRDEVDYIMDTFPIVRRKDEAKHGEYRTKRLILEIYDDLARCLATGHPTSPASTHLQPTPPSASPGLTGRAHDR